MPSVNKSITNGILWTAVGKYSTVIISIIVTAVLARLISPKEFGVVAIASVAIAFLSMISNMGFGPAIIQNKRLSAKDLDGIFSYTILIGLVLSILLICCAPFVAKYYNDESLKVITKLLAVELFFSTINIVPNSLFLKNKNFKFIAKRTFFINVITGIVSVVYAFYGGGCYALLVSPILSSILIFFVSLRVYPLKIDWNFSLKPIKAIFSYSFFQLLFNILNYFSRNLDKLLIGKYLNMSALGYYQKNYQLMMYPLANITSVINPVLQPFLSDYQDQKKMIASKNTKIFQILSSISFPIGMFFFFASEEIVRVMFGDQWLLAVPTFRILALSIPLQIIFSTSGSIYQSANATNYMFYVELFNSGITILGFILSLTFGKTIEWFALAWDITLTIGFVFSYIVLYKVVLKSSPICLFRQLLPMLTYAGIILIIDYMFQLFHIDFNLWLNLIFKGTLCLAIALIVMLLTKDVLLTIIIAKIKK